MSKCIKTTPVKRNLTLQIHVIRGFKIHIEQCAHGCFLCVFNVYKFNVAGILLPLTSPRFLADVSVERRTDMAHYSWTGIFSY